MSNEPVVFTEDEQRKLSELNSTGQEFFAILEVLKRGLFHGQDAATAAKGINLVTNFLKQTQLQIQAIEADARARASQPKLKDVSSEQK